MIPAHHHPHVVGAGGLALRGALGEDQGVWGSDRRVTRQARSVGLPARCRWRDLQGLVEVLRQAAQQRYRLIGGISESGDDLIFFIDLRMCIRPGFW